jgi:hypothetical protein
MFYLSTEKKLLFWLFCHLDICCGALGSNQDKLPVKLRYQVAAWVPVRLCNFYELKSYKIANNPATTEARENIGTHLESLECYKIFGACLTKFENHQILLN